ncbi:hypothetical protein Z969_07370 [Clostridium novyi A str. 4570]|uniref:tRNA (Guanine-N1)-methyltransferase n=1 Tax=Clostridium novyi A str. 4570 TaxID=1444290 RepID=A0AA88ZRU0_CLONO|nr:hypothetical protein [Clostridium novyi]KGN02024.1 hypothetical protein Z969_07370 [Clostridium novyi A str. 4570]
MPKPSIFSNNYDKQMKRRKITIIMVVVAIIIVLGFIISGILRKVDSKNKSSNKQVETKVETKEVKKANNKSSVASHEEENKNNSKNYNAKLSNGMEIKLIYNVVNNEKEYIKVEPDNIKYTISPSKKNICLVENETQNMILFDINGSGKDITKKEYVSSNGQSFAKDNILKSNPNYIWCENPIFLNDDNIIYISQLPWFNKADTKYVWKYTISSNNHINNFDSVGEISGKDIQYGNLTQDGLKITVDGVEKNLTIPK